MYRRSYWKRLLLVFSALALCLGLSVREVGATAADGVDPPDAYYAEIQTNSLTNWPQGPAVWAESAVVMDIDTGTILYGKAMDETKYPASITKIMTTLLAIEYASPDDSVLFSENAIYGIDEGSSSIGIQVGEILSMEDCLYAMMLASANEVCIAVAEHISGSVEEFANLMNQKAAELGCTNTHFENPNGLPNENHYTTAHDMALIAQAAYKNATFRKVCGTQIYCIPKTNITGEERWLANHHKMFPDAEYGYEYMTGGKTGYTQAALNTLVTYAEKDGRRLVCVSLRTNGKQYYIDTASMLDYAFDNFQNITIYSRKQDSAAAMVYPSLHFGENVTVSSLRTTTQITIPATATASDVVDTVAQTDDVISHTYTYQGYQVGYESIPAAQIRLLLTDKPEEKAVVYNGKATAEEQQAAVAAQSESVSARLIRLLPVILVVLVVLFVILMAVRIHMERERRRRRRRRAALRQRRLEQERGGRREPRPDVERRRTPQGRPPAGRNPAPAKRNSAPAGRNPSPGEEMRRSRETGRPRQAGGRSGSAGEMRAPADRGRAGRQTEMDARTRAQQDIRAAYRLQRLRDMRDEDD